jgi:S-adenosylmethionine:diacylglycerol 3-amino-3-carboxypropyl transferase
MTPTEKLVKALDDRQFCESLEMMKSEDEVMAAFAAKGISKEDMEDAEKVRESKEFSAEELAGVTGGELLRWVVKSGTKVLRAAPDALACNRHTNWGTNGRACICGMHNVRSIVKMLI